MQITAAPRGDRIIFLDYLRAYACLLVVFGHIFLVGTNDPKTVSIWVPTVSDYLFGPSGNVYTSAGLYAAIWFKIGVGALGVGIFFLISGFVILRAIEREGWHIFIVRRIFRIFPTSIISAALIGTIYGVYCQFTGIQNSRTVGSVFSSGFLISNYTNSFPVTPVLWSLEIEVIFYIIVAAAAAAFGKLRTREILSTSVGCLGAACVLVAVAKSNYISPAFILYFRHLSIVFTDITFLLIGGMIFRAYIDGWSLQSAAGIAASVLIYYTATICHGLLSQWEGLGIDAINSAYALLIFFVALIAKMEWRWIRPLRWFADISYPLYLMHVPLGWIILAILASMGCGVYAAVAVAMVVVIAAAWILHVAVELPSQNAGRKISKSLFAARAVRHSPSGSG